MLTLPAMGCSLLVRTDFSDDDAWRALVAEVETENEDGFCADAWPIDDATFDGQRWQALQTAAPADDAAVLFIADSVALQGAGHPVLVVSLSYPENEPFRCVTSELWGVDNNLNLANMDWEDFAGATVDGVFVGFPHADHGPDGPPPPPPMPLPGPQPVPSPPPRLRN